MNIDVNANPGTVSPDWRQCEIVSIQHETLAAVTLQLAVINDSISFEAGQYIKVKVIVNGHAHVRAYSISGAADNGNLQITVKAQAEGIVSRYLKEDATVGMLLHVSHAKGDFIVKTNNRPKVFLAMGSGITPIYAMLTHLRNADCRHNHLVYFNRNRHTTIFFDALAQWINDEKDFITVEHWFSDDNGRYDVEQDRLGLFNRIPPEADIYICGPQGWVSSLQHRLIALQLTYHSVSSESFGGDLEITTSGKVIQLTIETPTRTYKVSTKNTGTLLQILHKENIPIKSGCQAGRCGACLVKVTSGATSLITENRYLTHQELQQGFRLSCQSTLDSNAVIKLP